MKKLILALSLLLFSSPCWAAFPQNSVLFSCTGTDNTSPPSASWTTVGYPNLKLLSNKCIGSSSGSNADYWNPTTFNADQEVFATIATKGGTTADYVHLVFRFNSATVSGYMVSYYENTSGTDGIEIHRLDAGSDTELVSWPQEVVAGHQIGASAVGNIITAYYDGNVVGTYDISGDATKYTGTGKLGAVVIYTTTSPAFTNFGGGNYTSTGRRRVLVNQ